ncbi:hypothetical protein [Thiomonas sp.]
MKAAGNLKELAAWSRPRRGFELPANQAHQDRRKAARSSTRAAKHKGRDWD